ncbi:hypothetical protein CC1G_03859 [Coprinopsis cinerea okayama7|uniref:SnoaL-like domain-containing protein n=1 Tax=Coprinopsis cinerea (strain Okayama-7 / 130 / ATCC MYA-4618 / FGSC 9003) TaxID=240176 RepID=A8NH00_COPC7|nr:hypothetical protein CC1G_03859 [Coprinopsis cinerea okayama7\|eukprot:XP_001833642.2 hypothetical protein CC1G_03859 [Coprinopsis cinerea okayama7\
MASPVHSRSPSHTSTGPPPRSPSPPSQIFHKSLSIPPVPTPALLESVAGAAHYSGVPVDGSTGKRRRRSSARPTDVKNLKPDHQRVLDDLKELYCGRPSVEIFERSFRKDAVFEDPLSRCTGVDEIAAQFFALPKFFSKSETLASRVMSSTAVPNQIIYWQRQEYTARIWGSTKVIESIIVVDLDDDEKIVSLVDQWGGNDLPSWFGASLLRTINAKLMPWVIRVPKS